MPEKLSSLSQKNNSKINFQSMNTSTTEDMMPEKSKRSSIVIILSLITIIALGGFAWSFVNYRNAQKQITLLSTPEGQQKLAQSEINRLIEKVGKHYLLPTNETPVLATISDVAQLAKTEPFYEHAQNGDKLLIYPTTKRAILYNEKNDVIINVGPIVLNENAATPAAETQPSAPKQVSPISVEIRNGSPVVGAGSQVADQLKTNSFVQITRVGNAAKKDYKNITVVVADALKNSEAVRSLAQTIGSSQVVSALPEGESASTADVLIIVGGK